MEPGNPQAAIGTNGTNGHGKTEQRTGHAGWDFKDAFWSQWERVLGIRSGTVKGDLTGAVESLATLARMAADPEFVREWKKRPVHHMGKVAVPNLQDNQAAMELIADLVQRKGWAEKRRSISVLKPWTLPSEPGSGILPKDGLEGKRD